MYLHDDTHQTIRTWWDQKFQSQLQEIQRLKGSFSLNQIYLLISQDREPLVLKIYHEARQRVAKEFRAFNYLQNTGVTPEIIVAQKQDEILGNHIALMKYLDGDSMIVTFANLSQEGRRALVHKMAQTLKTIHNSKNRKRLARRMASYTTPIEKMLNNDIVKRHCPDEIHNTALSYLNKDLPEYIVGEGVFIHNDPHFGNFLQADGKLWAIDFENSRMGYLWEDLAYFIKYFTITYDAVRSNFPHLEHVYANGSLTDCLFDLRDAYPEMFDVKNREMIEIRLMTEVLGKLGHSEQDPEKPLHNESARFLFDTIFKHGLLDRLLIEV